MAEQPGAEQAWTRAVLACAAVMRGVKQHGIYRPTEDRGRMHLGLLSRLAELALTNTDAGRPYLSVAGMPAFGGRRSFCACFHCVQSWLAHRHGQLSALLAC